MKYRVIADILIIILTILVVRVLDAPVNMYFYMAMVFMSISLIFDSAARIKKKKNYHLFSIMLLIPPAVIWWFFNKENHVLPYLLVLLFLSGLGGLYLACATSKNRKPNP